MQMLNTEIVIAKCLLFKKHWRLIMIFSLLLQKYDQEFQKCSYNNKIITHETELWNVWII